MGVTGLWKLVESSGKPIPLETLENKVIAVDISIWLHQVIKGFQDSNGATVANAHLIGLFQRLSKLLFYKIKPIFVFDGIVPILKRETIRKRQQNKEKYNSEADRVQQLLLQTLAKEKVVQQALGSSGTNLLLKSPIKDKPTHGEDDMFKLPEMESPINLKSTLNNHPINDEENFNKKSALRHGNFNINSIDVTNDKFKTLPADIRHDILTDLKDTRKESSWGRLHELPVDSDQFSSFQMKRLIKRRQVQISLETAEKEMGGKSLSLVDLERLLTEDGIVDVCSKEAKCIASDENSYFYYVNDLNEAKKLTEQQPEQEEEENIPSSSKKKKTNPDVSVTEEADADLQKAILMSMEVFDDNREASIDVSVGYNEVKLSTEQKIAYGKVADKGIARAYMIEYGGMNSNDVKNLIDFENPADTSDVSFMYNKSLMKEILTEETTKNDSQQVQTDDVHSISSGADSDFIDVPDIDDITNLSLPSTIPLEMNVALVPDQSKDFRLSDLKVPVNLEIIIDRKTENSTEDLFADIFEDADKADIPSINVNVSHIVDCNKTCKNECIESRKLENIDMKNQNLESILKDLDSNLKEVNEKGLHLNAISVNEKSIEMDALKPEIEETKNHKQTNLQNILSELDDSLKTVKNQSTGTTLLDIHIPINETIKQSKTIEILDDSDVQALVKTPTKNDLKQTNINCYIEQNTKQQSRKSAQFIENNGSELLLTPSKRYPFPREICHQDNGNENEVVNKHIEKLFPKESPTIDVVDNNDKAIGFLRESRTTKELNSMATELKQDKLDLEYERNRLQRMGISISDRISSDCQELLKLFGIPFIVAPQEAEAQCAYLNEMNLTDGTITDDSDIWLFGGKTVYKNFFNQQKIVMEFRAENIQRYFNVDRDKLIQLSILVGSDYTCGISGIGAVTALEILATFKSVFDENKSTKATTILSGLQKFRKWWESNRNTEPNIKLRKKLKNILLAEDFPSRKVVEAYLYPEIDLNKDKFTWGYPDVNTIREFTKKRLGWTNNRTDEILLPVLKKMDEKKSQQTIRDYFQCQRIVSNASIPLSKRVKEAVKKMSTTKKHENTILGDNENEKPKRKRTDTKSKKGKLIIKNRNNTKLDCMEIDSTEQPSTSAISKLKIPNIPDPNPAIPQRLKDVIMLEQNKKKAIHVMTKLKKK